MKFGAITIKDIAKALGVSTSTVSRALRGSYEINPETKKEIIEYAEKYNYRPNPIAQSLKASKSMAIGVIVPEIANHFFSQAINGIEAIAYNRGYHVVISQSHESYEREVINIDHLFSRRVDGLLISISAQTEDITHLSALQENGIPVVFFDRTSDALNTHKVTSDNFTGAYNITKHLIQGGNNRIGLIASSSFLSITKERQEGYKKALSEFNIPFDIDYVKYCEWGGMVQEEVEQAVAELMQLSDKPTAIFSSSDRLSMGTLGAILKQGYKVPQEVAVAGFTNLKVADLLNPSLTAVVQPAFEMGQVATELLIQLIESKRPVTQFERKVLDTKLYIRESSSRINLSEEARLKI
jgi:LacI family transcriptional regulator